MHSENIYISSTCFKSDVLGRLIPEGIKGLELSGNCRFQTTEIIENALKKIKDSGVNLLIHGYFPPPAESFILNFASADAGVVDRSLELAGNAIRLCAALDIPYYSFHPGYLYDGSENSKGNFDFNPDSFLSYENALGHFHSNYGVLHSAADKHGMKLAVENLFIGRNNVKNSLNNSLEEIEALMSRIPKDAGLLLDLGHLNISAYHLGFSVNVFLKEYVRKFQNRIFEIHLSSNDGTFDNHEPLSENDWQLDALKMFKDCPGVKNKGVNLTLESRNLDDDLILKIHGMIEKAF